MPLFWTSGNICHGFQSQGLSTCLHASSPTCNGFLRFTSGVTPADLLVASMAAKPFQSTYLHTYKYLWGLSPGSSTRCLAVCNKTDVLAAEKRKKDCWCFIITKKRVREFVWGEKWKLVNKMTSFLNKSDRSIGSTCHGFLCSISCFNINRSSL